MKDWWKSRAIVGGIVTGLLGMVSVVLGTDVQDQSAPLAEGLIGVGIVVSTVITIVGRVRATKAIAPIIPPQK